MDIRALIGSGPNAEKSGENTLPFSQCAECGQVEFRATAQQRERPVALGDSVLRQNVREAIALGAQVSVAEIANGVVAADPAQCELAAAARQHMAVDGLMRDIEPAVGQTIEQGSRLRP